MGQPQAFGYDDDVVMLKDAARRFLDQREPLLALRKSIKGSEDPYRGQLREGWFDPAAWQEMTELGWPLIAIPEETGGLGLGLLAATAIQEEIGRAACPSPLSSTLMATFVLRAAGANACLSRIAEGATVSLAVFGSDGAPDADSTEVTAEGNRLSGISHFVQDAQKVDGFIVAARTKDGIGLYYLSSDAVTLHRDRIVDLTRDQARIEMQDAEAEVIAEPGTGEAVIAAALPALLTLLAADIAGAAEWQLQTTAEYAKTRSQFDRPIGFFQAVKHPIVDMMISTDATRSLVYNAACAFDHDPDDALRCARMAKASASDTAWFCSNRSTQMHGGIGVTWEADVQIYHKRQLHSLALFGDAAWQRRKLGEML